MTGAERRVPQPASYKAACGGASCRTPSSDSRPHPVVRQKAKFGSEKKTLTSVSHVSIGEFTPSFLSVVFLMRVNAARADKEIKVSALMASLVKKKNNSKLVS